jgi:hypothetical protein
MPLQDAPGNEEPTPRPGARYEQAPQRLRAGDRRRPAALALVIVSGLALAVWQPWTPSSRVVTADVDRSSTVPSAPPVVGTLAPGPAGPRLFTSITDNEWTVVALLNAAARGSTDEPATQHPPPAWSDAGPFLVLQQGLLPAPAPIEAAADVARDPSVLCVPTGVPRDRRVVPVPGGRVAYLGVTIPGDVPRPAVTATIVSASDQLLTRVVAPTIELAGMASGGPYTIPSTGPGGVILFAMSAPGPLPSAVYRFAVDSPAGPHYLYACVAP